MALRVKKKPKKKKKKPFPRCHQSPDALMPSYLPISQNPPIPLVNSGSRTRAFVRGSSSLQHFHHMGTVHAFDD
jgi:hypothetical protein